MARPSFQFYPGDWRSNAKLRRCSPSARGAWIDVLCVLHDSDEYGVIRWPLEDLARAAGAVLKDAQELVTKGVLKGDDLSPTPYIFTPFHAGKGGDPVTLVAVLDGQPCWYSTRLARDEWVRKRRGAGTRFTPDNQPATRSPTGRVGGDIGERQGDGPSSSSSSPEVSKKVFRSKARKSYSEDFEKFWAAYPIDKNMPKKKAFQVWQKLTPEKRLAATAAIPGFRRYCDENKKWYRVIYADRFLSQEKFAGYDAEQELTAEEIEINKDRADRLLRRGKYAESMT